MLYSSIAETTAQAQYNLSDIDFLDDKIVFQKPDFDKTKHDYVKKYYQKYVAKYEAISKKESDSTFNSDCLIVFSKRKVPPSVNGKTMKDESAIICFAKTNIAAIKKTFVDLLNKNYFDAVMKETDQFKIQHAPPNYNMPVNYFTPYMLSSKTPPTDIPQLFVDLNENGISYNSKDVIITYLSLF